MSVMSKSALTAAIKSIRSNRAKLQEQIHEALVSAAYYALSKDNNTTPLDQILDAMGNSLHIKGVTRWVELNLPVVIKNGKFSITKAGKEIALQNEEEFTEYEIEMRASPKWFEIAGKQKRESIFDTVVYLDHVYKKLEKEGQKEVADVLRKAVALANFKVEEIEVED